MHTLIPCALALASVAAATPALACSVARDYRVPTNLELVEGADLIVIGTVESGPADRAAMVDTAMVVRPIVALKGAMPSGMIRLTGTVGTSNSSVPSDPRELQRAHPSAYGGSCTRSAFEPGATVLFFLEYRDGVLRHANPPFSRWAEDVASADAPWAKAVGIYVKVAALPADRRAAALIAERDALLARKDDADAQLIAADIQRQLAGPKAR